MKYFGVIVCCILIFCFHCADNSLLNIFYKPPVIFTGYIDGNYDSLCGNLLWKNSCEMTGDTVRMYFYTKSFNEQNRIREGHLIRLDIYPGVESMIGTGGVLFHMARYHSTNNSYTIVPKDTLNNQNKVQMKVQRFGNRSSQQILLDEIYIRSSPVPGTFGPVLEIRNGKIEGVID